MESQYKFYIAHVSQSESNGINISAKSNLKESEYNDLLIYKSNITGFWSSQHVVRAVLENRNDLIRSVVVLCKEYLDCARDREEILHYGHFDLSRLVANLCGMFRSFLDHYDRYFKNSYGKESEEYRLWKAALSQEFDHHDGYKIISMIRNYIQHYDMPPIALSISENAGEDEISLKVDFDLKELMKDEKFREKFNRSGIEFTNRISLLNVINEWDECFQRIVEAANKIRIKECKISAQEILKIRNTLDIDLSGKIALLKLPIFDKKPNKLKLDLNWLPESQAKEILEY